MSSLSRPVQWLLDLVRGTGSFGEKRLSQEQAVTYAPIWYSVNKISNHIGQLPIHFYRRVMMPEGDAMGSEKATDDGRYMLLKARPNQYQTAFTFKSQLMSHVLLWGNGRAYINRSGRNIRELIPVLPDRTITVMIDGEKFHLTKPHAWDRLNLFENPTEEMRDVIMLPDSDVIHIPGFGFDGIEGMSLLTVAARSWNAGISGDKQINTQMSKGFAGKFMLEAPAGAFRNETDAKGFLEAFNRYHNGPDNADKVGLLREGIKMNTLSMSNQDAQFLENRKYQRQEAALWFLLESILGDDSSVSYNSLEQKNLGYLSNCLMTWVVKWEQELDAKLLSSRERNNDTNYFKFQTAALLRSDYKTTIDSLAIAIQNRIMNPNEARAVLEMNPYEGGEYYMNPATSSGADQMQQDAPESDEVDDPEDTVESDSVDSPNDLDRKVVQSHLEHLLGVEKNRLVEAAKSPNKFLAFMDKFYPKFEATLNRGVQKYCDNSDIASAWCKDSRARLLTLCDTATEEDFDPRLKEEIAAWDSRLNKLVTEVCEYV